MVDFEKLGKIEKSYELFEMPNSNVEVIEEILKQNRHVLEMNKMMLSLLTTIKISVPEEGS